MKKTKIIYRKTNGKAVPEHLDIYFEMLSQIKEGDCFEGEFANIKKGKSHEQLKYLFSTVYPFALYWFVETRGKEEPLYYNEVLGFKVGVQASIESVDFVFKVLFAEYKGKMYKKRHMKMDEMSEYIDFIDKWSIEHFGFPIPEAIKQGNTNEKLAQDKRV